MTMLGPSRLRLPGLLTTLALWSLTACASTSLTRQSANSQYTNESVRKVLVVDMQTDAIQRRIWENSIVAALAAEHVAATASYQLLPNRAPTAKELGAAAGQHGFDGVLATHLVGPDSLTYWNPGNPGLGFGSRSRSYGYWDAMRGPGYEQSATGVDYQTDLFIVTAGKDRLLWTGVTRSLDLNSLQQTTDQVGHIVVPTLVHKHILWAGGA